MLTTQALIDAALARGLEPKLPREWFYSHPRCPRCDSEQTEQGREYWKCTDLDCGYTFVAEGCVWVHDPEDVPDLTAPANLYELLRFADAILPRQISIHYYQTADLFSAGIECEYSVGPDRTTAVLTACAKALNIEEKIA